MKTIRTLRADEIEVRVQQIKQNGCVLFPYKDARCDMKILDETFTPMGWQRSHQEVNGNIYCTVSIYDEKMGWVSKSDAGNGGSFEKEKSEASGSFKRACVNWGIGRELYSSPFIWISLKEGETYSSGSGFKLVSGLEFSVKEVAYNDRQITKLIIVDNFGTVRFKFDPEKTIEQGEMIKRINESTSIEQLQSVWSTSPNEIKSKPMVIEAKDKKKEELSKPKPEEVNAIADVFSDAFKLNGNVSTEGAHKGVRTNKASKGS